MKKNMARFVYSLVLMGTVAATHAVAPVGDTIWLYHDVNGSYVTADAVDGYRLEASGTSSIGDAEQFVVEDAGGGNILLKAVVNGNYVRVNTSDVDKLYADTTDSGDILAHFIWTDLPEGKVRLTSAGDTDGSANVSPAGAAQVLRANESGTGSNTGFTWGEVGAIGTIDSLFATVDDESVALDWDDDASGVLDFYRVYRSAESGTNYTELASGLTESEYLDYGIPGGVTYYYVVTAVGTNGTEAPFSNEIAAVPNAVVRLQHLDAANAASVMTSSGVVTQWIDQASSGNDAVPSVGHILYPSASLASSGLAGLDMQSGRNSLELFSPAGSDRWLDQSGSTNGFCVMVALKCDAVRAGDNNDVIGNSSDGSSGFGMRLNGSGTIEAWLGGQVIPSAGERNIKNGETLVFALNYDAAAGTYDVWDSKNVISATGNLPRADFSLDAPVTLGSAAAATRYLDGMVGEVKVFGSRLSAANFKRTRDALMNKWIKRPNIVLIYVDDWAWNGTPVRMDERMQNSAMPDIMEMPNLESLATGGMIFRNAYGSPQCSPARAAVLTGQSNPRNGFTVYMNTDNYYDTGYTGFPVVPNGADQTLDPGATTIPEALRQLGYATALYGKWHNRGNPEDEFGVGYAPTPPANYDGSTEANKPGNTIAGTTLDGITDPKLMTWITTNGLNFMEQQDEEGNPFFLMLSHYAMHEGRECFPESRARYQNHPDVVAYNNGETNPANINRKSDPAVWFGMGYELDQKIGEVRQKLVDLEIEDNTYVIVVSDNGYREPFFDELYGLSQPLHAHKWMLWQAGIRVPMIVSGPGIEAGSRCTANVVNYDFLPTFVEWAGGDPDGLADADGISLSGLLEGEAPAPDFLNRSLFFHYPHYRDNLPHSAMVKGQEKVVYFYETPVTHTNWQPIMYFDLAGDAGEYSNIYPENPARAQELHAELTNYLAAVGARIPLVPNPDYVPAIYEGTDTNYLDNAKGYAYRMLRGPFVGTRTPEDDELGPSTFAEYWMDSFGVNLVSYTNDYDGDGLANLAEYALGGDPTDKLNMGFFPALDSEGGSLTYRYLKRNDDSSLSYTVESTTNLMSGVWRNAGGSAQVNMTDGSFNPVIHSISSDEPRSYIRLNISNE